MAGGGVRDYMLERYEKFIREVGERENGEYA